MELSTKILSAVLIILNENMEMIITIVKCVELNTKIVSVVLNKEALNMI